MRIRKGDKVAHTTTQTSISMVTKVRCSGEGYIQVQLSSGLRIFIPRSDVVRIVQKREDIKKFWEYL